jgi:hypothetical protein
LAGAAAGCGVLCDFMLLLPLAAPLGVYALATGSRRTSAGFVLGAAVPAALLLLWNAASYGAPWALPSAIAEHDTRDEARLGILFTVGYPRPLLALELIAGTRRGLLVFAPVFILGVAGLKVLLRRRRALGLLVCAVAVLTILQAAGRPLSWHGGTAAGPRYLLPAALALSLPLGSGLSRFPRLGIVLGSISVLLAWLTAQSPFYGSLQSCVEDVLRFAPRLRLVHSVGWLVDPSRDWTPVAAVLSPLVALPCALLVVGLLASSRVWRRRFGWGFCLVWIALALPYAIRGHGGTTRPGVRVSEIQRFVRSEREPRRLEWYGGELMALGQPRAAGEAFLRAIEVGGWRREDARQGLSDAIRALEAAGRGDEGRRFLERAVQLRPEAGPAPVRSG